MILHEPRCRTTTIAVSFHNQNAVRLPKSVGFIQKGPWVRAPQVTVYYKQIRITTRSQGHYQGPGAVVFFHTTGIPGPAVETTRHTNTACSVVRVDELDIDPIPWCEARPTWTDTGHQATSEDDREKCGDKFTGKRVQKGPVTLACHVLPPEPATRHHIMLDCAP